MIGQTKSAALEYACRPTAGAARAPAMMAPWLAAGTFSRNCDLLDIVPGCRLVHVNSFTQTNVCTIHDSVREKVSQCKDERSTLT
ncbi:hypothetical protein [Paraburkholderia sp. SIMBA_030]|uniref:hypothetical protein n=1 Tax=Paraburkholderia sp. SIMBA_030 TaxID=3085773 RepID=UPI003978DC8C